MAKYLAAVFDLDGTILDTSEGVLSSVRYAVDEMSIVLPSGTDLRSFIGPPIQDSFRIKAGLSKEDADRAASLFREHYMSCDLYLAKPYDGIYSLMNSMRSAGMKVGIATYKREDYAIRLLKRYDFDRFTDCMEGSDLNGRLKKKDIVIKCLIGMGIEPDERAVMIGDSDNDAEAAALDGMSFLGVTYGFGFSDRKDVDEFDNIGTSCDISEIAELCDIDLV